MPPLLTLAKDLAPFLIFKIGHNPPITVEVDPGPWIVPNVSQTVSQGHAWDLYGIRMGHPRTLCGTLQIV